MKKLLFFFSILMTPFMKAQTPKLGTDADPIRQMLFASQSMKEQLQLIMTDDPANPLKSLADAARLATAGKKEEAKAQIYKMLKLPNLETRIQLLAWSALRELGEEPDEKSGTEVLGAVFERPMKTGYDTLAAYQDGTARYLNFSGSAIFWEVRDATIQWLCQNLMDSAVSASSRATPRTDISLPKSGTQVTLLTRSGMYVIPDPPQAVIRGALALIVELIERDKKSKAG
ncbi:MAG TPA: hypothetical protein VHA33_19810 [Candidatus Angelobacter sp.]|jgi:hypothetical protein|nr:hypothetical protein [Candidatus Angelobacter sp.]